MNRVEVNIMELQIRIAFETAEMFEQLKEYYQETTGINFTKGDVLVKAINDTYDSWEEVKWENIKINIKSYDLPQGALRPKLQIPFETEEKLIQLKRILTNYLELNKIITTGAAIKYLHCTASPPASCREKLPSSCLTMDSTKVLQRIAIFSCRNL